jgi:hypothetical protein
MKRPGGKNFSMGKRPKTVFTSPPMGSPQTDSEFAQEVEEYRRPTEEAAGRGDERKEVKEEEENREGGGDEMEVKEEEEKPEIKEVEEEEREPVSTACPL